MDYYELKNIYVSYFPEWTTGLITTGIILLVLCLFAVTALWMKGKIRFYRIPLCMLLILYMFLVYSSTVLARVPYEGQHLNLTPFWEFKAFLAYDSHEMLKEIILNIIMLMPVGFFSPICLKGMKGNWIVSAATGTGTALLFSCFIEVSQYVSKRGLCEFDDVFNNTLGAFAASFLYVLFKKTVLERIRKSMTEKHSSMHSGSTPIS